MLRCHPSEDVQKFFFLILYGLLKFLPGPDLFFFYQFDDLLFHLIKLSRIYELIIQYPLPELSYTAILLFPIEPFITFISFMRTGSRVALRLGDFFYMHQDRHMFFTCHTFSLAIGFEADCPSSIPASILTPGPPGTRCLFSSPVSGRKLLSGSSA